MKEKIFEWIKNNLKNPRLYIIVIIGIIAVLILFPYIDANYFYYNRVEKRIEILDQITKIDEEKILENKILNEEYNSILSEIEKQKDGSLSSIFITDSSYDVNRNKFITGSLIFWLISILCIFLKMDKIWYRFFGFIFFVVVGAIFGYISVLIPIVINPICNYIFVPVLQCAFIGTIVTLGNKNK